MASLITDGKETLPQGSKFKDDIMGIIKKQNLISSWAESKTWAWALLSPSPVPVSIPSTQFTQQLPTTQKSAVTPTSTVTSKPTVTPTSTVTSKPTVTPTSTVKPTITTTTKQVSVQQQPKTISGSVEKEITSQTNNESIRTKPASLVNAELRAKNEAWLKKYNEEKNARIAKEQAWQMTTTTKLWESGMLNLTDDQTAAMKMQEVTGLRQSDIATNEADRNRTLEAGKQALDEFRNVVGIDKDGNVDMNRKWSIGATLQRDFDDYKKQQTELSKGYESTRKSRVSSQMRANLLARGVDISKIPQEQLIALSDEVGAKAFEDIYNNKQNTLNAITAKQDAVTARLNDLKEKWLIAEDKYNTLKATVESQFEKTRNDIQRNYVNDIFWITDTAKAKKEAKQTAAFNALESMLKAVPSTDAPALRERFLALVDKGVNVTDIIKAVGADTQFKELAKKLAESTQESEWVKAQLSASKTQAEIDKLRADANKAQKQWQASLISASKKWSSSSSTKVPYSNQPLTLTEISTLKKDFPNINFSWMTKWQAMNIVNQGQVPAGQ